MRVNLSFQSGNPSNVMLLCHPVNKIACKLNSLLYDLFVLTVTLVE